MNEKITRRKIGRFFPGKNSACEFFFHFRAKTDHGGKERNAKCGGG